MKRDSAKKWKVFVGGVYLFLFVMFLSVLAVEVYAVITVLTEGNAVLPANFGNFERVRALLADNKDPEQFSFAVAGDIQGTGTFEHLAELLKNENVAFLVLLGDCVRNGRSSYHQYFQAELAKELCMPYPTFYVVGNHDVIKNVKKDDFSISRFEKMYGPTNFFFEYQGCLFIVLRILDKPHYSTLESLAFLESVLSARRGDYHKVFVFMHIPPPVSTDFAARQFENPDRFIFLCDKFKVDYVIAGDYHGYARVQRGNTVYLVTGGGGAHLEKEKPGAFHHAVLITVYPQTVSERILAVERNEDFEDMIERWAIAEAYPWMKKHCGITILLNVGVIGCGIFLILKALKLRRSL
ncbi:MAG: metallophosphoesterase [Deltaproteobacteria bacterium]|nr:metallophosphoesterase [Deltaproteobacteria bacterium]